MEENLTTVKFTVKSECNIFCQSISIPSMWWEAPDLEPVVLRPSSSYHEFYWHIYSVHVCRIAKLKAQMAEVPIKQKNLKPQKWKNVKTCTLTLFQWNFERYLNMQQVLQKPFDGFSS